jgi:hypothetical protein
LNSRSASRCRCFLAGSTWRGRCGASQPERCEEGTELDSNSDRL